MIQYFKEFEHFLSEIEDRNSAESIILKCGSYIDRIDSLADDYHFNIYNTHGERHSKIVAGLCHQFLKTLPLLRLTSKEKRILFLAAYCHDLGMLSGDRRGHARQTQDILKDLWKVFGFLSETEMLAVGWVCALHSSRIDPDECPDICLVEHKTKNVSIRTRLLGGILRICDALHCTSDRVPPTIVQDRFAYMPDVQLREYCKHYIFENVEMHCEEQVIHIHLSGVLRHDFPDLRDISKEVLSHLKKEIASVAYVFAPNYRFAETNGRPFSYSLTIADTNGEPRFPLNKLNIISSQLIPTVRGFVGRAEIFDIVNKWMKDASSSIFVLGGIGGIGKTALLHAVLNKCDAPYVFFYGTEQRLSYEIFFQRILDLLPHEFKSDVEHFLALADEDAGTFEDRLVGFLGLVKRLSAIIVIDDYHLFQYPEIEKAILSLIAYCPGVRVFLSTRSFPVFCQDPKLRVRMVILDGLSLEETSELLSILGVRSDVLKNETAVRLVWSKAGNGHPLATIIFANLLSRMIGVGELIDILPDYQDEVWDLWVSKLCDGIAAEEFRLLEAMSVTRLPLSETAIQEILGAENASIFLGSLLKSFVVRRYPGRLYLAHPLLSEHIYVKIPEERKHELHTQVAEYYVPAATDFSSKRVFPLESYENAFHHSCLAYATDRAVSLAKKTLGDLILRGEFDKAELMISRLEALPGYDLWKDIWFLLRKARLRSLKREHKECQELLDYVEKRTESQIAAMEILQIRALDFIIQRRGDKAFDLLSKNLKSIRRPEVICRIALTAIKAMPKSTPSELIISHLMNLRDLWRDNPIHTARCDALMGSHLLGLGQVEESYRNLSKAVHTLEGFNRQEFLMCVQDLAECCKKIGKHKEAVAYLQIIQDDNQKNESAVS
ncbi:MAG: hypothetical protein JW836_13250 [Deltaproteobacteria bacterium]|nr:hypothetical protein [Deltaproteobacteria bacterium]